MKAKLLILLLLLSTVAIAQTESVETTLEYRQSENLTAERTYQDSTGFYIIYVTRHSWKEELISEWKNYRKIVNARYDSMQVWKDTVIKEWIDFRQHYKLYKSGGLYVVSDDGWRFYKPNTYEVDKDGYIIVDIGITIYNYDFLKPSLIDFMNYLKRKIGEHK